MSAETRQLSSNAHGNGAGSDVGDLVDGFGVIPVNPPWVLRKMQRLAAAHAGGSADAPADAAALADARDLLGALGLLEEVGGEG